MPELPAIQTEIQVDCVGFTAAGLLGIEEDQGGFPVITVSNLPLCWHTVVFPDEDEEEGGDP